ncbi:hypothetical protein LX15_004786 [Streptoalloteichus tenebrarius]|uniref:Uncharacterized protein n=1 Tax=Streptoalloteichus tenebrarius (strain ATCC 17920 / DSM 40477 / JCM 4838 / CBS 697.72 / NBRC 16177 / NCIMB 11028 / NRRL B-12390 / A12253. 1 / ISP 5477) TaxID=1933 RepID=A0ABT1HZV5_STRSD|nr:hypothetical protein [Streptoalloteichus tenebrarius]MCP2261066.1 hypothetical protein [Streptoalloteichus tenebrarius]BFF03138.1 hypothetical protein GCM10020241_48130 [Streptoalloteichus tenebrarius]
MTPTRALIVRLHSLPCAVCGRPAAGVALYPDQHVVAPCRCVIPVPWPPTTPPNQQ